MPYILFIPTDDKKEVEKVYQCPVYKTVARKGRLTTTGVSSNYVLTINLPCSEKPKKWTLRGTALLSELVD